MHDYHGQIISKRASVRIEIHDDSLKSFVELFNEFTEQVKLEFQTMMKGKEILINQRKRNRK